MERFTSDRQAEMNVALRAKHPGFPYSTSGGGAQAETGRRMPSPALIETDDYTLIYGNGPRPAGEEPRSWFGEDSPAVPNLGRRVGLTGVAPDCIM